MLILIYFAFQFLWVFILAVVIGLLVFSRLVVFRWTKSFILAAIAVVAPLVLGTSFVALNYVRENNDYAKPYEDSELVNLSRLCDFQDWFPGSNYESQKVVTYRVFKNRIYMGRADINVTFTVDTLDTSELTKTWLPGLERNVVKELNRLYEKAQDDEAARGKLRSILAGGAIKGKDTVLIADGDLLTFNFQKIFSGTTVMRSFSLDSELMARNLGDIGKDFLRRNSTGLVNGLPRTASEVTAVGLSSDSWEGWAGIAQKADQVISRQRIGAVSSKNAALVALTRQRAVVFVVAHSDGYSIYLPNGDQLTVQDIEAYKNGIARNRPLILLFSCETAKQTKLKSFAQALIEAGARMVVAPVSRVSAQNALHLLDTLLTKCLKEGLDVNSALERAYGETGIRDVERWIGMSHPIPEQPALSHLGGGLSIHDPNAPHQTSRSFSGVFPWLLLLRG